MAQNEGDLYVSLTSGSSQVGHVSVEVWPTSEQLSTARIGEPAPVNVVVREQETSSDGTAWISLHDIPADLVEPDGTFHVTVSGHTADGSDKGSYSLSLQRDADGHVAPAGSELGQFHRGDKAAVRLDMDVRKKVATLSTLPGRMAARTETPRLTRALFTEPVPVASNGQHTSRPSLSEGCIWKYGSLKSGVKQYWAPVYGWRYATGNAEITAASVHTLGVAASSSSGSWSQEGTRTVTTMDGSSTGPMLDRWAVNYLNYRNLYNSCGTGSRWLPAGFSAILPGVGADRPLAAHQYYRGKCYAYNTDQTIYKLTARASTYTSAVKLPLLSLSSQSGWNNDSKITWHTTRPSHYCGDTDAGPASSPRVDVRQ